MMKRIDTATLDELSHAAAGSDRRRRNLNLHPELADPVQRMLNALEPDSYVRPHRHSEPDKWELFVVLGGAAAVLTFDETGRVSERVGLAAEGSVRGVEIPAGEWHTLIAERPATVLLEVKRGPYVATHDKDFASWAPAEGETGVGDFLGWLRYATPGSTPPNLE